MSMLRLKFVNSYIDCRGKVRRYFRKPGQPRIPLLGDVGSGQFMAAYQAALGGQGSPLAAPAGVIAHARSVGALASLYYGSAAFKALKLTTQVSRRSGVEALRREHGPKRWGDLQRRHVKGWVDALADKPGAAANLLKAVRALAATAIDAGWRDDDPSRDLRPPKLSATGWEAWDEADVQAFTSRWALGSREHLCLIMALETAQRRGDLAAMAPPKDGAITLVQGKTGTSMVLPVTDTLAAAVAATPTGLKTILVDGKGKPFTSKALGGWFAEAAKAAGVDKPMHGLRKLGLTRLANGGASVFELQAVGGHKSMNQLQVYVRTVDQAKLAKSALAKGKPQQVA